MAVKHTFAIIIDVVLMLDGIKNAHRIGERKLLLSESVNAFCVCRRD